MLIKILFELDHVFKLHNIVKSQLHFKTSKRGADIFSGGGRAYMWMYFIADGPINGGAYKCGGRGGWGYNWKFTVVSQSGHFLVIFWILANSP